MLKIYILSFHLIRTTWKFIEFSPWYLIERRSSTISNNGEDMRAKSTPTYALCVQTKPIAIAWYIGISIVGKRHLGVQTKEHRAFYMKLYFSLIYVQFSCESNRYFYFAIFSIYNIKKTNQNKNQNPLFFISFFFVKIALFLLILLIFLFFPFLFPFSFNFNLIPSFVCNIRFILR